MKKNPGGRPRLAPGPRGKKSPTMTIRLSRPLLGRIKRAARKAKKPFTELAREVLDERFP